MMLNMSSAPSPTPADDRTGRARIRDAALQRFGDTGVDGTSLRAIADEAAVSPALVVHHFGSKDGLVQACDAHVVEAIRTSKHQAMAAGVGFDVLGAMRDAESRRPLLRYLARRLVDPSPEVAALVDDLVEDAVSYLAEGEQTGVVRPSDDPRGRAAVLTIWSLGGLVLHEHVTRLLGADLTADTAGLVTYSRRVVDILARGVLTEAIADRLLDAYDHLDDHLDDDLDGGPGSHVDDGPDDTSGAPADGPPD